MRLIQTLFSSGGFRNPASNQYRLSLIAELIRAIELEQPELLVLPAGVLTARNEAELDGCIGAIASIARPASLAIVGGVDVAGASKKHADKAGVDIDDLVRSGRLPFFGFVIGATTAEATVWRQTSTTNGNSTSVDPQAIPGDDRVVKVAGRRVGVLICGELFSRLARERFATTRPDTIIDLGHCGMGQGLIPAMKSLARSAGAAIGHSQHTTDWWGRQFHFVDASAGQHSVAVDETQVISSDDTWAAWYPRTV
jgi:hypothetical protein